MTQYIFNKINIENYNQLLLDFNIKLDIYYYSSYLSFDAKIQGGQYEIFVLTENEYIFIYPYIKVGFNISELKNKFDIIAPYGYSGPYSSNPLFFKKSEKLFINYASTFCITEFVRYHYLYNIESRFEININNILNRKIVTISFLKNFEDIWKNSFSATNRNIFRKLEKNSFNFSICSNTEIEKFMIMYYKTMENVKANEFYYFKYEIVEEMIKELNNDILLVKVEKEEITFCYSLFFIKNGFATYYLSARNHSFSNIPTTNFLLSKSIQYLSSKGINIINLGGGQVFDDSDPLFKFKKNFSKETHDFYIGKRIYDKASYDLLKTNWIISNGQENFKKIENILQFYR